MIKKTISYEDYDGNTREDDFYFNLNKAEMMEMEMSAEGGFINMIEKIVAERDQVKIMATFKDIILMSYGEKSLDGRRFIKNQELRDSFEQTEAYSNLFMELATNADKAADFINGIVPEVDQAPKGDSKEKALERLKEEQQKK